MFEILLILMSGSSREKKSIEDCNTDVEIQKLCPAGELPQELKERMRQIDWTPFMQEVFDFLHANEVTLYNSLSTQ